MNELIRTAVAVIGGEEQRTVNARDLWKALQSKRQFGNWIDDRLSDFIEGEDFTINKIVKTGKGASGKQLYKEYIITLDVAKHLAMLERNEHGRKIRDYFIEVEKEFRRKANANMELIQIVRFHERCADPVFEFLDPFCNRLSLCLIAGDFLLFDLRRDGYRPVCSAENFLSELDRAGEMRECGERIAFRFGGVWHY